MKDRVIFHSDLNAFYASVEMMLDPKLRGKAVAVCGSAEERHGIVLAKSELAKKAGVKTGEANWEAREKCPGLIVVPPQYDQYVKYSRLVQAIYKRYSDFVEPYGMDESWIDMSACCSSWDAGEKLADELREVVKSELGLTLSIGVSFNKTFAKLGSDMKKPDAVTVLSRENWKSRIWPLAVSELIFVGNRTARKLMDRGVFTIGDLARVEPEYLLSWFGKNGAGLWAAANGQEHARVMPIDFVSPVKSVGHGITCSRDLENEEEVWRVILELSQDVGHRLRHHQLSATGVRLCVRGHDLKTAIYQRKIPYPTQSPLEVAQAARILFQERYLWETKVRSLSVAGYDLVPRDQPMQLDLFGSEERRQKRQRLDDCVDELRRRFGNRVIGSASLMQGVPMPEDGRELVRMPGQMYV